MINDNRVIFFVNEHSYQPSINSSLQFVCDLIYYSGNKMLRNFVTKRCRKKNGSRQKRDDKVERNQLLTPEQQARYHLIEISNAECLSTPLEKQKQLRYQSSRSPTPSTPQKKSNRFNFTHNIRVHQSRNSVAEKLTQSFKYAMRPSASVSVSHGTQDSFFKRKKFPINVSHYLVLDDRSAQEIKQKQREVDQSYLKPSILPLRNFKKRSSSFNDDRQEISKFESRGRCNKLFPFQQSYWKIYNGKKNNKD